MNMTEKMKLLQGRGLAPDSFEQPTRPDKLVRTDTYSSYRSVRLWAISTADMYARLPAQVFVGT